MATSITLITILSALSLGNANFFDRGSLDTPLAPTAMDSMTDSMPPMMDIIAGQTISKGQNQRRRLQATVDAQYFPGPLSRDDAASACAALGSVLMEITTAEENVLVGSLMPQSENSWVWIANIVGDGGYTTPFLPGRPNGADQCVRFFSLVWSTYEDSWDDQSCADAGPYVCGVETAKPTQEPTPVPTAAPTDACYDVQCVDLFTCDVESDQFETVTDYPCKRDCDLFGFDEYLDQCSAIFPSAIEAVTALIGEVNESVQRITDSDIPAFTARVQINEDAVADINNELSTMHLLVGELSNVDAAMNESIADLVTDINEDLSSVTSLIGALSDVDTTLNNSIAAVTVLAESALIALEERVAFLEVRIENFGASGKDFSAAKTADEHMYAGGDSIALSGSLLAKYKDEILGALVTANFFVMVACACMISSRNNKKFKYVSVVGDEEAGTENEN